jgi:hypothetical protein
MTDSRKINAALFNEPLSGDKLVRAGNRAFLRLFHDGKMTAASDSAGFIYTIGGKKYQVFVKVCEFSDELLASDPNSGGLLCESSRPEPR